MPSSIRALSSSQRFSYHTTTITATAAATKIVASLSSSQSRRQSRRHDGAMIPFKAMTMSANSLKSVQKRREKAERFLKQSRPLSSFFVYEMLIDV